MEIIYYKDEAPRNITKSIFLAGGSLRPNQKGESWRKDAIQILDDKGFDGVIFCPENRDGNFNESLDYEKTVEWEEKFLNMADCILFWVPRDLSLDENGNLRMGCLTTNIEFGAWANSGKIVFGAPPDAPKNNYLKYYAKKYNVPMGETLTETLDDAMDYLGKGAKRSGGERYVPLFIWKLDSFQSWYKAQTEAGNRLDGARLLYTFRPGFKSFVFLWLLKADMYITSEDRHKTNEFVLSRPDISSILLWRRNNDVLEESEVVIVKEFRTPASTDDGFIRELVGGSSKKNDHPEEIAAEEILEETGFAVKTERLKHHQSRQLCGTLSAHKSHFYSVELTKEEIEWFKSQKGIVHGVAEDSERTFIEVYSIKEILADNNFDWTTLGEIFVAWNSVNGSQEE